MFLLKYDQFFHRNKKKVVYAQKEKNLARKTYELSTNDLNCR